MTSAMRIRTIVMLSVVALLSGLLVAPVSAAPVVNNGHSGDHRDGCQLRSDNGKIKHVIYVQFDNVHFLRDNPNVPSDLEQMPNLLNFIRDNGTSTRTITPS